jgi:hypothetical protein
MTKIDGEWMSLRQTMRVLGLGCYGVQRLAAMGSLKTQILPGQAIRFNRADAERIAAESAAPAMAGVGGE